MVWWGRIISPARGTTAQHCCYSTNCGLELLLLVSVSYLHSTYCSIARKAEHDTVQRALHAAQVTRPVNCTQRPSCVPIQG